VDVVLLLLHRSALGIACLHQTEKSSNTLTTVGLNSSAFGRVIAIAGDDRSKPEDDTSKLSDSIMSVLPSQMFQYCVIDYI
jgi:hypothetical protein